MTRLLLEINESLGEVECDWKSPETYWHNKTHFEGEENTVCRKCHGKGTRPAWLRGCVEVFRRKDAVSNCYLSTWNGREGGLNICRGSEVELANAILEAHKSGTPPAELYRPSYKIRPGVFGTGPEDGLEVCYE